MKLTIPEFALVVLIGPSGAGKSTFAAQHFLTTEVLSSDACRGLVSDDPTSQEATSDAFDVLRFIAAKRLAARRLTVIDATNVQAEARKPLLALAREYHCLRLAIVFDLPEALCQERNRQRPDRHFGAHVIRQQVQQLRRSMRTLEREGFRYIYTLSSPEEVAAAVVERQPLWCNLQQEHGPFDIIGDVHGCLEELQQLLRTLGYEVYESRDAAGEVDYHVQPPAGRRAIFLGDLVDRGPQTPGVLRLVMSMVAGGSALCVPGNHDMKLLRKLRGRPVQITHGLAESLTQLAAEPPMFVERVIAFLDTLVSHYVLDNGRLVVAHAGMSAALQGRASGKVRTFALYGDTTGETDEFGLPIRADWAAAYRGNATVVYGHTPVLEPAWLNRTINIDTGCVFGGKLTALRYPERQLVSVPAARVYYPPVKPLHGSVASAPALSAQQQHDELLDIDDVVGKRSIATRLAHHVTIREEQAMAALEVMSRFAVNPKWLIYLPPTMSPCETSQAPGWLEHPAEAFAYYQRQGVSTVVCEEKHMGSRAVVIVCRDEEVARQRFGMVGEGSGICYTRTGRRFFADQALETALLNRLSATVGAAGLWDTLDTPWLCLDCEILPWSAKAEALLRQQYAAVGTAARTALADTVTLLAQAAQRQTEAETSAAATLLGQHRERAAMVAQYIETYRRYCWEVRSVDDLALAPFHLLATEGAVHIQKDHVWHLETLATLCRVPASSSTATPAAPLLRATAYSVVDVTDPASQAAGVRWWETLTAQGGEGMVVKPRDFVVHGRRGLIQPAIKCRGREYLRLIYGPEYTAPAHLERLRTRHLATKRGLALRQFALGIEALERFVRYEPLRRVHECVFGILALGKRTSGSPSVNRFLERHQSMKQFPTFIDLEATSLGSASYPIEVAWNSPAGAIETHLISPAGIASWTDWSAKAEKLHGISRSALLKHGKSPAWICRRMNQQLADQVVYSDDPEYDGVWLARLFAAYYGAGPIFALHSANDLLIRLVCPSGGYVPGWERLEAMKKAARQELGRQHRAAWDVEYLVTLYRMVTESQRGG